MFCSKCGTRAEAGASTCQSCGAALGQLNGPAAAIVQPQIVVVKSAKSGGLAAVLSFLWCGLGQIYNGQIGKGIVFMFVYFISFLMIFVVIGLITTPILWIWGMVDAHNTAERLNREQGLV